MKTIKGRGDSTRANQHGPERDLRSAVMATAPHMSKAPVRAKANSGGFDLDLEGGSDDLDDEFSRRGAA